MPGNSELSMLGGKGCSKSGSKLHDIFSSPRILLFLCWTRPHGPCNWTSWWCCDVYISGVCFTSFHSHITKPSHRVALMVVWQSSSKGSEHNTFQTSTFGNSIYGEGTCRGYPDCGTTWLDDAQQWKIFHSLKTVSNSSPVFLLFFPKHELSS